MDYSAAQLLSNKKTGTLEMPSTALADLSPTLVNSCDTVNLFDRQRIFEYPFPQSLTPIAVRWKCPNVNRPLGHLSLVSIDTNFIKTEKVRQSC
jgi:hypothetical protein